MKKDGRLGRALYQPSITSPQDMYSNPQVEKQEWRVFWWPRPGTHTGTRRSDTDLDSVDTAATVIVAFPRGRFVKVVSPDLVPTVATELDELRPGCELGRSGRL